jgi:GNAT superfamily N-acetyltransferase
MSFAVAPNYQRQGLGSRLLAHLQQKARDHGYFIIAGGLLDPAVGCLMRSGFRLAGTAYGGPICKWNHLPEHAGDDFPGKDEPDVSEE